MSNRISPDYSFIKMTSSPSKSPLMSPKSYVDSGDETEQDEFVIPPPKIPPIPFNFTQTGDYDINSKEGFEKLKKHIANYVDNIEIKLQETFEGEDLIKSDKADDDKTTTVLLLNALKKADLIISEVDRPTYKKKIDLEMESGEEVTIKSPKKTDKTF